MFFITPAMAADAAPAIGDQAQLMNIGLLVLMFVAMWFFIIRPQQKRQKEHQKLVAGLSVGDEVITIGGLSGLVVKADTDTVHLQVAAVDGKPVVVSFSRNSVQAVLPKGTVSF